VVSFLGLKRFLAEVSFEVSSRVRGAVSPAEAAPIRRRVVTKKRRLQRAECVIVIRPGWMVTIDDE
jgi:hypothetical protein